MNKIRQLQVEIWLIASIVFSLSWRKRAGAWCRTRGGRLPADARHRLRRERKAVVFSVLRSQLIRTYKVLRRLRSATILGGGDVRRGIESADVRSARGCQVVAGKPMQNALWLADISTSVAKQLPAVCHIRAGWRAGGRGARRRGSAVDRVISTLTSR